MKSPLLSLLFIGVCGIASASSEDDMYVQAAAEHVREAVAQKQPLPWKKGALVVPNGEVAKAIHRAVAGAVYGKADVDTERPFRAVRSGDFWVVFGSLPRGRTGGTAITVIRASDGRVMRIIHEQ
jgi:hypothetical protein